MDFKCKPFCLIKPVDLDNVIVAWLHPACTYVNQIQIVFALKDKGDVQCVFNLSSIKLYIVSFILGQRKL